MSKIVVVGAGVSGLVSADALVQAGHEVNVVASATGPTLTSAAAGAIWLPFRSSVDLDIVRWARTTRRWLEQLASSTPAAGIDVVKVEFASETQEAPWWAPALDTPPTVERHPHADCYVWSFNAPRVEPALFCSYFEQLLSNRISIGTVRSFDDIDADLIINCSGLGSRTLAKDQSVKALFGQTVVVAAGEHDLSLCVSDERSEEDLFYAIPRRAEIVLGGCAFEVPGNSPAVPSAEMRETLLARAQRHGIKRGQILRDSAGLRPYRPTVRLEREGRVIHNYGHGGSGYTVCRGCAEDVVRLAAKV